MLPIFLMVSDREDSTCPLKSELLFHVMDGFCCCKKRFDYKASCVTWVRITRRSITMCFFWHYHFAEQYLWQLRMACLANDWKGCLGIQQECWMCDFIIASSSVWTKFLNRCYVFSMKKKKWGWHILLWLLVIKMFYGPMAKRSCKQSV